MSCVGWVRGISAGVDDMYEKKQFNAPGPQFLWFMTAMYLGIRGFMDYAQYYAANPLPQRVGIGTEEGAQITSTMRLPWSLKCVWAMVSDSQPIFHYKKRWYMLAATVAGSWALWQLGTLPFAALRGEDGAGTYMLALLLLVNTMGSLDDILTQGQYTKVIKAKGSSILVFRSTCMATAQMCVALFSGVLNDNGPRGPQYLILTALPWAIFACFPIGFNMMADERQPEPCKTDTELIRRSTKVFTLATAMGITVLVNVSFSVVADLKPLKEERMLTTGALMVGVLALSFYTIDRRIAKINVYLFLCRLCTFGLTFPLQQFYTTDPTTCPDPDYNLPNFSFFIFSTFGNLASSFATFLGLYLFENYLVHWNAPKAFWVTTAFQVIAGMFDIMNTTRFNQTLLGWTGIGANKIAIPENIFKPGDGSRLVRVDDLCTFLFGTAFLEPLIDQLDQLPSTLLLSKLCPKGVETTMFAILAGFSNIGLSMSGQIGGWAVSQFGFNFKSATNDTETGYTPSICDMGGSAETNNNPASFHGLARTLIIGNIILPFLTIPLTWCFIPNQPLDQPFLDVDDDDEKDAREVELQGPPVGAGESFTAAAGGTDERRPSFDPVLFRAARSNVSGSGLLM